MTHRRNPDGLDFFRGLVTAACISGCIWIAAGAITWAIFKGHFG